MTSHVLTGVLTERLRWMRRQTAVFVSLRPILSKAADFAILVRNFKQLILGGYSAQKSVHFVSFS